MPLQIEYAMVHASDLAAIAFLMICLSFSRKCESAFRTLGFSMPRTLYDCAGASGLMWWVMRSGHMRSAYGCRNPSKTRVDGSGSTLDHDVCTHSCLCHIPCATPCMHEKRLMRCCSN